MTIELPLGGSRPIPKGWSLFTLNDLKAPEDYSCCAGPFGSSISSKFFVSEGVPVIRGSNLTDDLTRFVPEGFVFVSEQQARTYKGARVQANDLVFTCWGTIGQVGIIPENGPFPEYIISNKQLKLRVNTEIVNPLFLFYYLSSPEGVEHFKGRASGSAVPGLNLGVLKSIQVAVPNLETQGAILAALTPYDDLIQANLRRISLLEEAARLIYREWFVHLRFPGHERVRVVEGVPEGWERKPIGSVASYVNRGVAPKYSERATGVVINQKCIRDFLINMEPARHHDTKVPSDKNVCQWDVLVNSTGTGTLGRVAQIRFPLENATIDTHVTIVRPGEGMDPHFFGLAIEAFQPHFQGLGHGATNQAELQRDRIKETPMLLPPEVLQAKFGRLVGDMRKQSFVLGKQNKALQAARDLLLPRLMSGSLEV